MKIKNCTFKLVFIQTENRPYMLNLVLENPRWTPIKIFTCLQINLNRQYINSSPKHGLQLQQMSGNTYYQFNMLWCLSFKMILVVCAATLISIRNKIRNSHTHYLLYSDVYLETQIVNLYLTEQTSKSDFFRVWHPEFQKQSLLRLYKRS